MDHAPHRASLRLSRRDRRLVAAAAAVTALACGGAWTVTAASAAPAAPPAVPVAAATASTVATASTTASTSSGSPSPTRPPSTRTSRTWTFEDGTTGGWYGFGYGASMGPGAQSPAWVAPAPEAARSGRAGLLVADLPHWAYQVAVDLTSDLLAPGDYAVTAQVRLAPGQPATPLGVLGAGLADVRPVTDAAWTTLTGTVAVPDGVTGRLLIGPGRPSCESDLMDVTAPATRFYLDQVTLTRLTTRPEEPTAPTACPSRPPAPAPLVMLHHEVTSTSPGGFTATLTMHNLQGRNDPIVGWTVPLRLAGRRVLWVAGARLVTEGGTPKLTGTPASPTAAIYGDSTYRVSLGLSGSPVGSHAIFGAVEQAPTGWE